MGREVEPKSKGGLRVLDGLALVGVGVVGALVAFWALHAVVGIVWGLVKLAVVVAVVLATLWWLAARRSG
ncbi:MAG TPA: hypothetical protein VKV36_02955 [Acidimicrobiales bacterium]|nr:hypothetical protein [Acidimicrobiales bacterium]